MEQIKKIIVYAVDQALQDLEAFIRCSSLAWMLLQSTWFIFHDIAAAVSILSEHDSSNVLGV